jgi:hypothetical protein
MTSHLQPRLVTLTSSAYRSNRSPKFLSGILPDAPDKISFSISAAHIDASVFVSKIFDRRTRLRHTEASQPFPFFRNDAIFSVIQSVKVP